MASEDKISDEDILRCAKYFRSSDIVKLIEAFDDNESEYLHRIAEKYTNDQTKVYWVLKKWLGTNPNTSRPMLQTKLRLLGFSKAAKK